MTTDVDPEEAVVIGHGVGRGGRGRAEDAEAAEAAAEAAEGAAAGDA